MSMQWRGAVIFSPDDHELWRLVQKRVAAKLSWEEIAAEIGCDVAPLLEWVNYGYKAKKLPSVAIAHPVAYQGRPITSHRSMSEEARRFENWRRMQAGAAKTRAGLQ